MSHLDKVMNKNLSWSEMRADFKELLQAQKLQRYLSF